MLESGAGRRMDNNRATLADILGTDFAPGYFIFEHEDFFSLACASKSIRQCLKGIPLWLDEEVPEYVSILQPRVYRMNVGIRESSISFLKKFPKIVRCEVEQDFDQEMYSIQVQSELIQLPSALESLPKLEHLKCHLLDIPSFYSPPALHIEAWPKLTHLEIECHGGKTIQDHVERPVLLLCPVVIKQQLHTLDLGSVSLTCEELVLPSSLRHLSIAHLTSKLYSLKLSSGLESLELADLPDLPILDSLPDTLHTIDLAKMNSSIHLDPLPKVLKHLHLTHIPDLHLGALPATLTRATFDGISSPPVSIPSKVEYLKVALSTFLNVTLPDSLVNLKVGAESPAVVDVHISNEQLEKRLPSSLKLLYCFGLSTGDVFRIPPSLTSCRFCSNDVVKHIVCRSSLVELDLCCVKNVQRALDTHITKFTYNAGKTKPREKKWVS